MGTMHQQRKEERAKHSDPINFTCGVCQKVVKFQENYVCSNCEEEKEVMEVIE